ncbi:MAG: terminase small subunit [Bacteroidales bacterium]|nr:terminase small subunit [Bacteroidales bacterium]
MASIIETKLTKPIENKGNKKLTYKQLRFIDEYILCGSVKQAMKNAGYKGTDGDLVYRGNALLRDKTVISEIEARKAEIHCATILSATEIMELYSKIARGEVQDQFGLDPSLKDRIAAMKELAKYQIEMPMKLAEQQRDNTLNVKLIRD